MVIQIIDTVERQGAAFRQIRDRLALVLLVVRHRAVVAAWHHRKAPAFVIEQGKRRIVARLEYLPADVVIPGFCYLDLRRGGEHKVITGGYGIREFDGRALPILRGREGLAFRIPDEQERRFAHPACGACWTSGTYGDIYLNTASSNSGGNTDIMRTITPWISPLSKHFRYLEYNPKCSGIGRQS